MRAGLALVVGSFVAFHSAVASADEAPAERLFREGRARMLEGRFDEACPMLAESQRLDPHVGTLLNLAACHERQNRIGSAWVEYQKALTAARAEGQSERIALAEARIRALEPRVPWLTVTVRSDAVAATLDGATLAPASFGHEMPVDPGLHIVSATEPAATDFEEQIELREGEHRSVDVHFAERAAPLPERIVVEPKAPPAVEEAKRGRFIFEAGAFFADVFGRVSAVANPQPLYPSTVRFYEGTGSSLTSCASTTCQLSDISEGDGLTGGVSLYGGYAVTDAIDLGARFIAGPEIGVAGASVIAIGPAVSLHVTDWLSFGAWALLGNATLKGSAQLEPPPGYSLFSGDSMVKAKGSLEGGPGVGLELSVRLARFGRSSLMAQSTPFVIAGSGTAVCLPVGLAYRFQ